jgi:phage-related protein
MNVVKRCYFVGPTKKILSAMPAEVKTAVGNSLYLAQTGKEAGNAKALKGFGGRGVLEVVEDFDGNAYRAVYTIRYSKASMCFTFFRRSQNPALPRRNMKLN